MITCGLNHLGGENNILILTLPYLINMQLHYLPKIGPLNI